MPQKTGESQTERIDIAVSVKFVGYLDELIRLEGFGNSRAEVFRVLAWREIERLIEVGRLIDPAAQRRSARTRRSR